MIKNDLPQSGIFEITEYGSLSSLLNSDNKRGVLFVYVISGRLHAFSEERKKTLSSGECLSVSLGRGYTFHADEAAPCTALYIAADGSLVYDLLRFYNISDFMSVTSHSAFEAIEEIQHRMETDVTYDANGDITTAFHRFLFKLKRSNRLGIRSGGTASEIKKYIDSHLEIKLTLDELSNVFFVSKTQIFRIFKKAYGIAPMQYFLKNKVELAKKMLEDGSLRISDIAEALAFTDAKHFTKTFKHLTGELPRDFRKRVVQKSNESTHNTEETK